MGICCSQSGASPDSEVKDEIPTADSTADSGVKKEIPAAEDLPGVQERLRKFVEERPYLGHEHHYLNYNVKTCQRAIDEENLEEAQNVIEQLTMESHVEEAQIAAAFVKFDANADDMLNGDEIKFMMSYLGFPCTPEDLETIADILDVDNDESVVYEEFVKWVGDMGGSPKLFELRRKSGVALPHSPSRKTVDNPARDQELVRMKLLECGVQPDCMACWQLVAGETEIDGVVGLEPCQQAAIRHIRALAYENHQRALPEVQERVAKLGFVDSDLWMVLAWIREQAPIIIHMDLDGMLPYLQRDTHYRNQFETKRSGGLKNLTVREQWEEQLFGNAYKDARPFDRPKYGVQSVWNDHRGVMGCEQYGETYMVLKDVRMRCTLAPEDSANMPARRLSVLDFYAHILLEYSDKELTEVIKVAKGGLVANRGDSMKVIGQWGKYKEAQVHGPICFSQHVECLVVPEHYRKIRQNTLQAVGKKHGFEIVWMEDLKKDKDQKRRTILRGCTQAIDDWRNLHGLPPRGKGDPCRMNCGRVAGLNGGYCCMGCCFGYGHDLTCGQFSTGSMSTRAAAQLTRGPFSTGSMSKRASAYLFNR